MRFLPPLLQALGIAAQAGSRVPFCTGGWSVTPQIAVAPSGRVFVDQESIIALLSPTGVKEAEHPMPGGRAGWEYDAFLSAAPDGCTLFFGKDEYFFGLDAPPGRFNACTGAMLPDFTLSDGRRKVMDVQPLPDGTVLVAGEDDVRLYDASGTFIRVVALRPTSGRLERIAIAGDGQSLWLASAGTCGLAELVRVSMSDGSELERRYVRPNTFSGLVAGAGHYDVPALGPATLGILAATLALAAILVLRR